MIYHVRHINCKSKALLIPATSIPRLQCFSPSRTRPNWGPIAGCHLCSCGSGGVTRHHFCCVLLGVVTKRCVGRVYMDMFYTKSDKWILGDSRVKYGVSLVQSYGVSSSSNGCYQFLMQGQRGGGWQRLDHSQMDDTTAPFCKNSVWAYL